MQLVLICLLIILPPTFSAAHPGKTDRYGGHRCLKECAEWDLYYAEYHLHDKEGRPIRVAKKERVRKQSLREEPLPEQPAVEEAKASVVSQTIPAPPVQAMMEAEPDPPFLLWLLVLLLLLLLLLIGRRRSEDGKDNR